MNNWQNVLNKFLEDFKDKDYVIGAVLSGSYASGNNTSRSDIDINIVTTETKYKERGNKIIDGIMIEYFINPVSELYNYMEDDHKNRKRMSTACMFGYGKILFDKTGEVLEVKNKALEYYNIPFDKPDEIVMMCNNYTCWDLMDELKDKINNNENTEFNYYMLLKELINNYFYKNNIATVPFTKVERILRNKEYRLNYHLKNEPNEIFIELSLKCFDNKDFNSIEKLYEYVIEDFKITDFILKTKMN